MRRVIVHERPLLNHLLAQDDIQCDIEVIFVEAMADGGMGSLLLHAEKIGRQLGAEAASCTFFDVDGVLVSAVINLDQHGELFELDVWKTDFSPLERWPSNEDLA